LDPRSGPLLLVVMKLLFLDIAACNLLVVSVLNELNLSLLVFKINIDLILTLTSSIDWNKEVDSTRTESVMFTEANNRNGVVHCYWNKNLHISYLLQICFKNNRQLPGKNELPR